MNRVDMSTVVPASRMKGGDAEDTALLKAQLARARDYLGSYVWCRGIRESYFGDGVGGIIAAFLFRIDAPPDVSEWFWVIAGDLPCCCMPASVAARTPWKAMEVYCGAMEDWATAVRAGKPLDNVYPVRIEPTTDWADDIASRVGFVRREILPALLSQADR